MLRQFGATGQHTLEMLPGSASTSVTQQMATKTGTIVSPLVTSTQFQQIFLTASTIFENFCIQPLTSLLIVVIHNMYGTITQ